VDYLQVEVRLHTAIHLGMRCGASVGFILVAYACDERMFAGCWDNMKDFDRARAGHDHAPFGKANPLIGILSEQCVALCPVFRFVFLPVRMNPFSNFRRQTFD
jgi:hypothetical protein